MLPQIVLAVLIALAGVSPSLALSSQPAAMVDQGYAEFPWAYPGPDTIRILRVPYGYLQPIMGHQSCHPFSPTVLDPNCENQFRVDLMLQMMLPDMGPVAKGLTDSGEERSEVRVMVNTTARAHGKSGRELVRALGRILLSFIDQAPNVAAPKPAKFGLSRIGIVGAGVNNSYAPMLSDLYFDGTDIGNSNVFIECKDESFADRYVGTSGGLATAMCLEHFFEPQAGMLVEAEIPRTSLQDWQGIRDRISAVLASFIQR